MGEVRWTERAFHDLEAIYEYIRDASPATAFATIQRIAHSIDQLESFPRRGRVLPEDPGGRYRELVVRAHRVIYRAEGQDVWLVAIVAARQFMDVDSLETT